MTIIEEKPYQYIDEIIFYYFAPCGEKSDYPNIGWMKCFSCEKGFNMLIDGKCQECYEKE